MQNAGAGRTRRLVAVTFLLASAPSCIVLDGCESLTVAEGAGGGPGGSTTSTAADATGSASTGGGQGPGSGGAGSGGDGGQGGSCTPALEVCGDATDEDCDGVAEGCPAGAWWELLDDVEGHHVHSVATTGDGGALVGASLTGTGFVVTRISAAGQVSWSRVFEGDDTIPVVVAWGDGASYFATTAWGPIVTDGEHFAGELDRAIGLVARLSDQSGETEGLRALDGTEGNTTVDAMIFTVLEGAPQVLLAGAFDQQLDLGTPETVLNGPNAHLVSLEPDLAIRAAQTVFITLGAGASVRPDLLRARGDAILVGGLIDGTFDAPTAGPMTVPPFTGFAQGHRFTDGSTNPTWFADFESVNGQQTVTAGDLAASGEAHVAVHTTDRETLSLGGVETDLPPGEGVVYVRMGADGALGLAWPFDDGIEVGTIDLVDDDARIVMGGLVDGIADIGALTVDGGFVAELQTPDGEPTAPAWELSLRARDAGVLRVALDREDPARTFLVAGLHRGVEPVTGSDVGDVLLPFVARLTR